ncbi:MAG TPA: hypothetical protein VLY84_05555 [Dysgonamonadaceae bacterium]|nr:hypothetical protein [Dysgonamonadaceae bacterium]
MYLSSNFIKRIFSNPALGLLPYLIFSILIAQINMVAALAIGLVLSLLPWVFGMRAEKRLLYDISAWSFLITGIALFLIIPDRPPLFVFIFSEIIFVFSLMIFRLTRKSLIRRMHRTLHPERKYYLFESFQVRFQTQYALTFHLILILGFRLFFFIYFPLLGFIPIVSSFQLIIAVIIVLEAFRLNMLSKRLKEEEWLPVISESGDVQGKVAKSVSENMKNKFLHPMVRVALIHDNMLFLKKREPTRLLDPGKLDYPFEKYMQYNHNIEEAIENAVKQEIKTDSLPVRFLLKYIFENENTKRLIFLYVSIISDENDFRELHLKEGKLWTINQIEDNIGNGVFSECLELEFEYLKNTVLMNISKQEVH